MSTPICMPEIAANMASARIVAWYRAEGDTIVAGEPLADIETDKAVIEYTAEVSGILEKILVPAGAEASVGAPIALLVSKCSQHQQASAAQPMIEQVVAPAVATPDVPTTTASEHIRDTPAVPARVMASPLARRLATQAGLDLSGVQGSGPHGRIVRRDIDRLLSVKTQQAGHGADPLPAHRPAAASAVPAVSAVPEVAAEHVTLTDVKRTPHTAMRRTIARRLLESKTTIPHFYLRMDCRADALVALRQEINHTASCKVSLNDLIVRAVAVTLRGHPEMNVSWSEEALLSYDTVDIAVAVSTPGGLITPVIRQADTLTVSHLSGRITELADKARSGRLAPDEYQGGSFTVSNLGMYGIPDFSAIINPPQSAILAVGAVQMRPVVDTDGVSLVAAHMMSVTLSVDHRAIDGAVAAGWLAEFKRCIEQPLLLLV